MRVPIVTSWMHRAAAAFMAALTVLMFCGCETTSTIVSDQSQTRTSIPAGTQVVLLSPLIMYDSATDGSLGVISSQTSEIPTFIKDTVRRQLQTNGIEVIESETSGNFSPEVKVTCADLTSSSAQLVTHATPEQITKIKSIATAEQKRALLANFVRLKTGPGGYWDPNTGAIGSDMSTTHIRAVIIDCATGAPIWKSQVYLRKKANIKDRDFRTSVENLYTNITTANHL